VELGIFTTINRMVHPRTLLLPCFSLISYKRCNTEFYYVGKIPRIRVGCPSLQRRVHAFKMVTVRSLLPVHERGTAYHLTFDYLHHHSTRLRNICNPTSFNCLSPPCRACDYVYIDYVRRSRSSSCRLLRPINCQTYITLHYIFSQPSIYIDGWLYGMRMTSVTLRCL